MNNELTYWKTKSKLDSIMKKLDCLTDYIFILFPPTTPEAMEQFKEILTRRRAIEYKKEQKKKEREEKRFKEIAKDTIKEQTP